MIFNAVGGGGTSINLKVKSFATEEELLVYTPKENTIGIPTTSDITQWIFSIEEPSDPTEGMLWIMLSDSSDFSFNVLKKNVLKVDPIGVKQYLSGKWVTNKKARIYQNKEWHKLVAELIIYDSGVFGENVNGATFSVKVKDKNGGGQYASISQNSANMLWSNNGGLGLFYVEPKVICDKYDTLNINIEDANVTTSSAYPGKWGIVSSTDYMNPGFASYTGFSSLSGDSTLTLDVSNVGSTEYYVAMQFSASSGNSSTITKIWLEK